MRSTIIKYRSEAMEANKAESPCNQKSVRVYHHHGSIILHALQTQVSNDA
jgi:hypothetical protein